MFLGTSLEREFLFKHNPVVGGVQGYNGLRKSESKRTDWPH